ncbi:MAG: isoprenylcysteine carboxylmethyltransferase family protein [Ginsengibacter sp.]
MNVHLWLIILWAGYCVLHSFLAGIKIKKQIQKFMGLSFKYYRPAYSIFSAITLVLILWFQYSIVSPQLFSRTALLYLSGFVIGIPGLVLMLICINKYFYELSGLQAIQHSSVKQTLHQSGLHKYVRHPLYLGTLLFIWGLFLIFPVLSNLIAALIITLYVLIGIRIEEKKLLLEYGNSYLEYSKKVPKIVPHIHIIKKGSL